MNVYEQNSALPPEQENAPAPGQENAPASDGENESAHAAPVAEVPIVILVSTRTDAK